MMIRNRGEDALTAKTKLLITHHYIGNDLQDLIMAAAASGGAVCHFFYAFKSRKNIFHTGKIMQSVHNITIAYLLTVADHIIFDHILYLHTCRCKLPKVLLEYSVPSIFVNRFVQRGAFLL